MPRDTAQQRADLDTWEQRRYWQDGALVDSEWWNDGVLSAEGCDAMPAEVQTRDYCAQHRTPIYPDLGCQVCRQRPASDRPPAAPVPTVPSRKSRARAAPAPAAPGDLQEEQTSAPWEQRRYWQGTILMEIVWWSHQQPVPEGPETPPEQVLKRDYCYLHGTPLTAALGCQVCGQRPPRVRR